jgi:hypothetical protein
MNMVIGVIAGIAIGSLLGVAMWGGRGRSSVRADKTGFATPFNVPDPPPSAPVASQGSATLPLGETQITPRRQTLPDVREIAASSELLHIAHETRRTVSVADHAGAAVEAVIPAHPKAVVEKSAPGSLEIAGKVSEAEILNRLTAVVEESRRQYARQADGAVRDTVGRDDVTTTNLGEMRAIPPPARLDTTPQPSQASLGVGGDSSVATPQSPLESSAAPPQLPDASMGTTIPSQLDAVSAGPQEPATIGQQAAPAEARAPGVDSATSSAPVQTSPLLWMVGNQHLAAWLPLTNNAPSHGALVTGILLAIAVDGAINVLGTHQRTGAMQNMPPSPALLAGILPQTPPGRTPPAPPTVPPAPRGPAGPAAPTGGAPAAPTATTSPGAAPKAVPGSPVTPAQTMAVVPEAVAVRFPAVDAKLNQIAQQLRQATVARTGTSQPASPQEVTQSVNDWAKSVQEGVRVRLREAAKSVGKTAASLRSVQATKSAGSNLVTDALNPAASGVDQSVGDQPDEHDLD